MINSSRLTVNLFKNSNINLLKFSTKHIGTINNKSKDFDNTYNSHDKNEKRNFFYENRIQLFLALTGIAGQ